MSKKVVAVIVEGPSDENAIGGILKEYFSSEEVRFEVVHGDITSRNDIAIDNIVIEIGSLIDSIKSKYGYKDEDFIKIIHIADMDGAFVNGCIFEADVEGVQYFEDHIECPNVKAIEKRNEHKAEILQKLSSTGKVHNIYYRLYFNSCNLEHVLYDELKDFTDDEKETMSDDFAEKYEGRLQDFIDFISDSAIAVQGTYKKTWQFIEKDNHSLKRYTNMHLIFTR